MPRLFFNRCSIMKQLVIIVCCILSCTASLTYCDRHCAMPFQCTNQTDNACLCGWCESTRTCTAWNICTNRPADSHLKCLNPGPSWVIFGNRKMAGNNHCANRHGLTELATIFLAIGIVLCCAVCGIIVCLVVWLLRRKHVVVAIRQGYWGL